VKYTVNDEVSQGKASGKIYGASTIGGIIFTFIVGFWLVPSFGLSNTAFFISVLIIIIPVLNLVRNKRKIFLIVPLIFVVVGIAGTSNKSKAAGIKIIHQSEGLLGQLLVVDHVKDNSGNTDRILFVNRMGQTWIDKKSGNSIWTYPNYLAVLASGLKEKPEVLILGIGGGTVANVLANTINANVEAVELDKRIGDIAKNNFNLNRNIKVNIDDARHYLRITDKKFDLIVFDVFKGEVPPAHVLTVECFSDVRKNLKKNGCLIINFNGFLEGKQGKAGRSIIKTLIAANYNVQIFPTFGSDSERNILYVASIDNINFNNTRLHLNLYNKQVNIDSLKLPVENIKFAENDMILSDDYPVLDILNTEAAKIWRNAYNKDYTKKYSEKGIPIFK
jgi:spermidine synthase